MAAALVTAALVTAAIAADDDAQRLRAMQAQLDQLAQTITASKDRVATTRRQLGDLEQRIDAQQTALRERAHRLRAQHQQTQRLQQQLDARATQVKHAVTALRDPLQQLFAHRRQSWMQDLLDPDHAHVRRRAVGYLDAMHQSQLTDLTTAFDDLQTLHAQRNAVAQAGAQLSALQGVERADLARMAMDQRVRQALLERSRIDRAHQDAQYRQLQAAAHRLQTLLSDLSLNLADIPQDAGQPLPINQIKGALPWPVKGRLATRFGSRRQFGDLRWAGVIIHAAIGSRVTAIARGRVAYADRLLGYGLLIVLDHGQRLFSVYGHNASLFRVVGDWVDAGEVIAAVGHTGESQQPALYFGIRLNGQPVDPRQWCRQTPDQRAG